MKSKFTGEILYFFLRQEAGFQTLLTNTGNLVELAGRRRCAKLILEKEQLDMVVQVARKWFNDHPCLFLIDDIWCGLSDPATTSLFAS